MLLTIFKIEAWNKEKRIDERRNVRFQNNSWSLLIADKNRGKYRLKINKTPENIRLQNFIKGVGFWLRRFNNNDYIIIRTFSKYRSKLIINFLKEIFNISCSDIIFDKNFYLKLIKSDNSILELNFRNIKGVFVDKIAISGKDLVLESEIIKDLIEKGEITRIQLVFKKYNKFLIKIINDGRIAIIPSPQLQVMDSIIKFILYGV